MGELSARPLAAIGAAFFRLLNPKAPAVTVLAVLASADPARTQELLRLSEPQLETSFPLVGTPTGLALLFFALLAIAVIIVHFAAHRSAQRRILELEAQLAHRRAELDRATTILRSDPQIVIAWDRPDAKPTIDGALASDPGGELSSRALDFASWLVPGSAASVGEAKRRLLERGEAFSLSAVDTQARHIEIEGRPVSGAAVIRIRDASGDRLRLVESREALAQKEESLDALRRALDAAGTPAWLRDQSGRLVWCNRAYAEAVEVTDARAAVDAGAELFDPGDRSEAIKAAKEGGVWQRRIGAVARGERHTFDAVEVGSAHGSSGLARDVTEVATLRAEMDRNEDNYARMLDRLATAVAAFDKSKRLTFYNAAYCQIWSLEPAFLDQRPTDSEILDRLRARHILPEQADFRAWKAQQMAAYQAMEPSETVWYLPDGRALRVVTNPNPQGGVTYLYDDATQSFTLESRVHAMTHAQGETLDALKEGVAVFGADGRMNLFNPAFAAMWRFDRTKLGERPHVDVISAGARALCEQPALWDLLCAAIVGLSERRESQELRIKRTDGLTLDCAALPLPDGATLVTSLDVTASADVEQALTERNQALIEAEKLRNDFVNHVSYELRTPLTNIIGFTQLLAAGGVGPLNPKQLEYAGFITNSSHALLAIIDDILDLASIDAGALELRLETVDVPEAMKAAAAGVQDRLDEARIEMRIVMTDGVGALLADGRRVRQVLFNLLSNAINYSEAGQTVSLAAMRRGSEIVFKISDRGRGIPPEMVDRVFERFETFSNGSRHRGPGLGLSIVRALVELHKGRVLIDTAPGEGTTVTCIFPVDPAAVASAEQDKFDAEDAPLRRAGDSRA